MVFTLLTTSRAVNIECERQMNFWTNHGDILECIVYRISVLSSEESIEAVTFKKSGFWDSSEESQEDISSAENITSVDIPNTENITSFYIYLSPNCHYIPKNVAKHFTNIKVLVVARSGLKVVRQQDLEPLKKLENLYLDYNQIQSLDGNLFTFNPNIAYINFSNNQIKTIALDAFTPLKMIKELGFGENICLDKKANNENEVQELLIEMKLKCAPVDENIF